MANLFRWLSAADSQRSNPTVSLNDLLQSFQFGGLNYGLQMGGTPSEKAEPIGDNFQGYVQGAYQTNGVVFACMAARQLLFSEARFQFRQLRNGRPGDLFGTPELGILERPWTGATTGDLLTRAILDADLAGNFYGVRRNNMIRRLRPDWVTIVLGSRSGSELDSEVIGYSYKPGGPASGEDPVTLFPEQVVHFAPYPDPLAKYRGMSWLSPILEEVIADRSTTTHKRNFFENGAKLGYVVSLDPERKLNPDQFERWVKTFKAGHEGELNAYKTLFLTGGADVKPVSANLQEADFKQVQGAGETRICAAARVPPIIVGVSEGLASATYSNYGQARRAFADLTMRPLWRNMAGSFARVVNVPASSELWFDDRDIPFLQEDLKDEAEIQQTQANAIRTLTDAGFTAESAVAAVTAGDLTMLVHSGLFSVQLQPAGSTPATPVVNGNGNGQPILPASTS